MYIYAISLGNDFSFADLNGLVEQYFVSVENATKLHARMTPTHILMSTEQVRHYDSLLLFGRDGDPIYHGIPIRATPPTNSNPADMREPNTEITPEIRSLAYAAQSMSHAELCQAIAQKVAEADEAARIDEISTCVKHGNIVGAPATGFRYYLHYRLAELKADKEK